MEKQSEKKINSAFSDDPVLVPGPDDWLNREVFAENFTRLLRSAGRDRSVVFALYGRYGEGKTTVLNFVEHILKREAHAEGDSGTPVLIRFEPWIFSNSENLIRAFFSEVASQLPGKFPKDQAKAKEAASRLSALGNTLEWAGKSVEAIEPLAKLLGFPGMAKYFGEGLSTSAAVAKAGLNVAKPSSSPTVAEEKAEFEKALKNMPRPIVVVLDDFDRLTPDEALLMMQLVKATTNVKGLHYLLVADRINLEKHLQAKSLPPEYLEKIVQYDLTLPSVDPQLLKAKLKEAFHEILEATKNADDSWLGRWEMLHLGPGRLFFTTVRSVKRFLASFEFYVTAFREDGYVEVDLVELWAVELLRVFAPEAHRTLYESKERIFRESISEIFDASETSTEQIVGPIVEHASHQIKPKVRNILEWLIGTERTEIVLRDQNQWLNMSLRTPEFFAAYFRIELPEAQIKQRDLGEWKQAAAKDSPGHLKDLIVARSSKLGVDSVVRAVESRWSAFNQQEKWSFVQALCSIDTTGTSSIRVDSGRSRLLAAWLSEMAARDQRVKCLEQLGQHANCRPSILTFVLNDQRDAWIKNLPLLTRANRAGFLKQISQATQSLAAAGDDLNCFNKLEVLRIWSLYGNRSVINKWVRKQCLERTRALQFIYSIGDRKATSSYWNGKSREVSFLIPCPIAALLPVDHKKLRNEFLSYAKESGIEDESRAFEDAAWCMARADEDASMRRKALKSMPELSHSFVWVSDDNQYNTANLLRLIVPVPDPQHWLKEVILGKEGVRRVEVCEYANSVVGRRSKAALIELSESHVQPQERADRLATFGIRGGWVWMNSAFGIIDPESGELCWTGVASDHVFYSGPERLFIELTE